MKKIALIFPYLRESGICKVPATHSMMFTGQGYEVDLVVRDSLIEYPYEGNIVDLKIKSRIGLLKALTYFELLYKVYRLKKQKQYDIVISHTPHCNLINVLTKKNEKTIVTTHITSDFHNLMATFTLRFILKKCDYMVAVSESLSGTLKSQFSKFNEKISCIYNPIVLDNMKEKACVALPDIEGEYLLTVGRLSKQKAHWSLIKAFSVISNDFPELKLIILGDGTLEHQLKKLVKNLNLEQKILFKGFDNNPYRYMKNCELFVLSSLNEGFPLVLLEALASNAPIISSDCISGPREILSPTSGLLEELNYNHSFEFGYLYSNRGADVNFDYQCISHADKRLAEVMEKALNNKNELERLKKIGKSRLDALSLESIYSEWAKLFK